MLSLAHAPAACCSSFRARLSRPAADARPKGAARIVSAARRGFTLAEMMIVVTLVAIITAMVMPKIDYTSYRVDVGARSIRVALQRAAAYAVSSQHNMLVAFDVPNGRVFIVEDVNNNLAADPGERVTSVPLQDGVVFAAPGTTWSGAPAPTGAVTGTSLAQISVNSELLPGFVFRCDGAASTDAQIYLSSARALVTDARGINVTQATGRTDWYRNMGATWTLGGF
jgi:prepilin-type N-terminal cleavage/methylation domain-containing protein